MSAASEVAYLSRALKAPRTRQTAETLAKQAREEGWDYEAYLAAVLAEEVNARKTHCGSNRVRAARFPQVKTLDDFDFSFQPSVNQKQLRELASCAHVEGAENVILLGPPGTGKIHPVHRSRGAGRPPGIPGALCHRPGMGGQVGTG